MTNPATMTHPEPSSRIPQLSKALWIALAAGAFAIGVLILKVLAGGDHAHAGSHDLPTAWGLGIMPFVAILACIAVLPLMSWSHHWWENNLNRLGVALICGGLTIGYYVAFVGTGAAVSAMEHAIIAEYIPFIMLLFSLYVVSGGIRLTGDLVAKPSTNVMFLGVGAAMASFIGTTGASMLLIRPLLQTNSERKHVVHTVVFFIFLVSNVGGTLLPIGDPPLFLGFLYGVPFFWTMGLWAEWLVACIILLVVYFIWDSIAYKREEAKDIQRDMTERAPLRLSGAINFLWLLGIVGAVAFVTPGKPFPVLGFTVPMFMREILMLGFIALSLWTTPKGVREGNKFNYAAIGEVAALFIGIFIAMQVPIQVLQYYGPELTSELITEPWHFFWATGGLSAFLDNAPTYVVFFELSKTMDVDPNTVMLTLDTGAQIATNLLVAVSLGAVFMGAMTYIGNGPNFMVKAIAEQSGVKMPSFFGYMFRYSIPILVPVFVIIMVMFLL